MLLNLYQRKLANNHKCCHPHVFKNGYTGIFEKITGTS